MSGGANIYRMMYRRLFLFLVLVMGVLHGFSQVSTYLSGTVTDKKSGEAISYAIVKYKGSSDGVMTDSAGNFYLKKSGALTTIEVSILGYKPFTYNTNPRDTNHLKLKLTPDNVELNEVIIKPKKHKRIIDTTALIIYHHVVDNKPRNKPSNIESYYYQEYTKIDYSVLDVPKKIKDSHFFKPFGFFFDRKDTLADGTQYTPLLVQEEYSEEYYRKHPAKTSRIIHYKRISGLKSPNVVKYLSHQFASLDIYDDVYIIFLKSFMSPFAPGGRIAYDYHVLDTMKIDGRTSYKLNFVGRNNNDLSMKGYAWIDSATWAISYITMHPNEAANLNFMREYDITQTFKLVNDSSWMMMSENLKGVGNIIKSMKKLSVLIDKTSMRRNVKTDVRMPENLAHVPDQLVDRDAYKKKFSYIDTVRFDSLDAKEKHVYHNFDTLHTVPKYKELKWLYSLFTTANLKAGPIEFGRLYKAISRNAVEDYRIRMGVRTNYDFSDKMLLSAYTAYGTKDKQWKYEGDARFFLPTHFDRWHAIEFEYKKDMTIIGQENTFLTFDNITTLLSKELNNVVKVREVNILYERDWFKGLSSNMGFTAKKYFSLPGEFEFRAPDYTGINYVPQNFHVTEVSANLRYCKTEQYFDGYTYRYWLTSKAPAVTFTFAMGVKNLFRGDYAYQKLTGEFYHRWQLPVIGYSIINLRAGYIFGDAPYPVAYLPSSNIGFLRDNYSFQLTRPFEFVMDKYLQVWYEHYFDGLLFNRIPYIKRFHLREFIMCKMLWGGYSAHNAALILLPAGMTTPSAKPYVELGVGVENIFKVIQLNFIWRATYRDVPGAQSFGFKIGIKPGF